MISLSTYLDNLAASIGLDSFTVKTVVCLFITFPFSAVLKRLPDNNINAKCLYIIAVSGFYLFGIMNIFDGFVTLMISSLGSYFITKYIKSPYMPWINFVFSMAHLTTSHLKSQFFISSEYNPNTVDITGAQMVLVMKMTSFGWSVNDGRIAEEDFARLSDTQKSKKISKCPNLLSFMGYVFFFPSLMTGPSFDYADYDRWLHGTIFSDVPEHKKPGKTRKRMIPKNGTTVFWKVVQGIVWAVLFFKSGSYFSSDELFKPEFKTKSFPVRAFALYFLGLVYRLRYYAAWTISEAGCILCGLGYNGYDPTTKKFKWNAVQNIDPWKFETGQNAHVCLEAWNMNTNKWLKNYVYLRVKKKDRKPGFKSTLFTFFVSAFWHGTRPGYYICFIGGALFQTCMRIYRRNIRPMFLNRGPVVKGVYDVICLVVTQLSFGYTVMPFILLDLDRSLYCWSTVYFYPLIGVAVTLFAFKGPFSGKIIKLCKQYTIADENEKKDTKPAIKDPRLAQILKDKQQFEYNSLGVPNLELNKEEFEESMKDLNEMADELKTWNNTHRRQSLSEGQEVMKAALQDWKKDVMGKSE